MELLHKKWGAALWIFFVAVFSRLFPHPSNFTAMQAIALFGNRWMASSWMTSVVLLLAQFSTDMLMGFYRGFEFVYISLILTRLCATWVGPIQGCRRSLGWGFLSCVGFFLLSNFGCWWKGDLYSQDMRGLLACYTAALPFFVNHLLGTVFYALGLERLSMAVNPKQQKSQISSQRAVV